jgi:hypothetical protein
MIRNPDSTLIIDPALLQGIDPLILYRKYRLLGNFGQLLTFLKSGAVPDFPRHCQVEKDL